MDDLYYPNEHALLCSWFGLPCPGACQDIDLYDPPEDAQGIWPEQSWDSDDEKAEANAVARIVLGAIQKRLPQVGICNRESEVVLGRSYYPKPDRPVELLPQFLFMINWADSAPGLSWPESYHVTYLPGYERYVVTASWDSTDVHGYTELAIGWFDGNEDVLIGAKNVITGWWRGALQEYGQSRWAYVLEEGLVSKAEAESWADALWDDGYEVDGAMRIIQAEGADEDEISEALDTLVLAFTERHPFTAGREKAEAAFARCLDLEKIPLAHLTGIARAVGQLGCDGRYLVSRLMGLLDDQRLSDENKIRTSIVYALDNIKPTDITAHNRLVNLLVDMSASDSLRWACAQALHTITGLEEYATIRAMVPGELIVRTAAHDSPIYRGGRAWYHPNPSKAMRKAAQHALSELTRRQATRQ